MERATGLGDGTGARRGFWISFGISVGIPLYFGLVSLAYRLSHSPIVQDDQRLHIVWLQQWRDSQLFQNDLIAQYYQSIQPIGFRTFYWTAAQLGVEPITLAAVLPLILAFVSSMVLYRVTMRLLPHPLAPLFAVLIFNQNIWCKDDLVSASPRSFAYLLLILFLDRLIALNRSPQTPWIPAIGCLVVLGLQGLFYPQLMLISLGVLWLRLVHWQNGTLGWSRDRFPLAIVGLVLSGLVLLRFSQNAGLFGQVFSAAEMRSMPEFLPGGRRAYFGANPLQFWFGGASGLRFPLFPPILWAAIGLWVIDRKGRIASRIQPEVRVLAQVMIAAVGWFGLAHLTFPLLYLPSRYPFYSARVVMAIAAGMVLTVWIDRFWRWVQSRQIWRLRDRMVAVLVGLFAIVAVALPAIPPLFWSNQGWITTSEAQLYSFLADQPKDSVIASLSAVADNIPAFSRRSVLFSPELALPYHSGFYQTMQERITDVVAAQYSPDVSQVKSMIEKYNIRLWIIEPESFLPDYLLKQSWLMNSSMRSAVLETATLFQQGKQQGKQPVLQQFSPQCQIFSGESHVVIDTSCIVQKS